MSHHSSVPDDRQKALMEAMKHAMGEYPDGRLNAQDAGALALSVGVEGNSVVLRFPKPVAWIGFTGDQAMEIAQLLMTYGRRAGITAQVVLRIGE